MQPSYRLGLSLLFGFLVLGAHAADPKAAKEKSPADLAGEAFFKLRDEKDAPPTPERQAAIIAEGIAFLKQYPGHGRANSVINSLATFGTTMKDKKMALQRVAWLSQVQYQVLAQGEDAAKVKAAPEALMALSTATAGALAKEVPSRENSADFRDKIDRLAAMPEGGRFLADQERTYLQMLRASNNLPGAEKRATALLASPEKRVALMAQEELNLILLAKEPLGLSFTALDGKTVAMATLRGQPVFFLFFATTNEGAVKEVEAMQEAIAELPRGKFEVILVSCDKAEDRAAVEKLVKKYRVTFPVWFAGQGLQNELGAKLNVNKLPVTAAFDASGKFVSVGSKFSGSQVKRMLGIK